MESVKHPIYDLHPGNYFGELSFFTGQEYDYSVRSKEFCVLHKLNREIFMEIVSRNEDDLELFCLIKDQLSMQGNFSLVKKINCQTCNGKDHLD